MTTPLVTYLTQFQSMTCNKQKGRVAPHKSVMLLAVMDSVSKGFITEGFVPQDERMVRCFMRIWDKYVGQSLVFRPIFATPFYHLSNEPFWTLIKTDGYVEQREYSLSALRRCFSGAKIEDDLWGYMLDPNTRDQLVKILLGSIMSDQE